jgi:hypothetical protein
MRQMLLGSSSVLLHCKEMDREKQLLDVTATKAYACLETSTWLWYHGAGFLNQRFENLNKTCWLYCSAMITDSNVGLCRNPQIHERGIGGHVSRMCQKESFDSHYPCSGPRLFSCEKHYRRQVVRKRERASF